jgi:hypothetical protein
MRAQSRLIGLTAAVVLMLAACGVADSGSTTEVVSGFIFIDASGSHICGSVLESYPPQCGEPSVELLDLEPTSVVALMSSEDPTFAAASWTDYIAGVEGDGDGSGLSNTALTDPVYASSSESIVLRTVDLGLKIGEPGVWPFDLTNDADTDMTLTFTSGQRMELTLSDSSGEVFRWSDGMMFTQAIEQVGLPVGATYPLVLRSEPINLSPGKYTATAWVAADEVGKIVLTWTVNVSS